MRKHVLVLFILCLSAVAFCGEAAKERPSVEEQILKQVNELRGAHQLAALKESARLRAAALAHCKLLVRQHALSHQFEGEPELSARISAAGEHWQAIGENVGFATFADDLETGWEHSPPHRKNLLDARFTEVGIAVVEVGDRYYGVQDFALATSDVSSDEAERRMEAAFNKLRARHQKPAARFAAEPKIRAAMCSMAAEDRVGAGGLEKLGWGEHFVAFTAGEPEQLPSSISLLAQNDGAGTIHIGVCHAASKTYPSGTYWIGVIY